MTAGEGSPVSLGEEKGRHSPLHLDLLESVLREGLVFASSSVGVFISGAFGAGPGRVVIIL